jgi:hypothetical protein
MYVNVGFHLQCPWNHGLNNEVMGSNPIGDNKILNSKNVLLNQISLHQNAF